MSELKDLQQQFTNALFSKQSISAFVSSDNAAQRFNIYRQTVLENLRHALEITYPGVWLLLGKACADSTAHAFCCEQQYAPQTGCLDDWGELFTSFLGTYPKLTDLPYLQDYAHYEWIKQLAYKAPKHASISSAALSQIPNAQLAGLIIHLVPACYLYQSIYPIQQIAGIAHNPQSDAIDLVCHTVYAVITRIENHVLTLWVAADLWFFIATIKDNAPLEEATMKTTEQYPDFKLETALHFLLQQQLIKALIIKEDTPCTY